MGRFALAWPPVAGRPAAGSLLFDLLYRPPAMPTGALVTEGGLALVMATLNLVAASGVIFALLAYALGRLRREQASVERLLLNVLPASIAERMRAGETAIADSFKEVTILFADVVGFTRLASAYPACRPAPLPDPDHAQVDRLGHGLVAGVIRMEMVAMVELGPDVLRVGRGAMLEFGG